MIYCVVPRALKDDLYDRLVEHYRDEPNVEVIVDRILRYERLEEDLGDLLAELGLEAPPLPRAYGGIRSLGPAGRTMTQAQVDRVGELFAAEIELLGYRPPPVA